MCRGCSGAATLANKPNGLVIGLLDMTSLAGPSEQLPLGPSCKRQGLGRGPASCSLLATRSLGTHRPGRCTSREARQRAIRPHQGVRRHWLFGCRCPQRPSTPRSAPLLPRPVLHSPRPGEKRKEKNFACLFLSFLLGPRPVPLTAFRAPFLAFFGAQSRRGRRRQEPVEAVNLVPQPVRRAEGVDQSGLGFCQLGKSRRRSSLRRSVTAVDGIA